MEGTVTDIANQDDYKEVHLEDGSVIETTAVIVATGATHRKLGVEGEAKFAGAGVSYCATCDGAFFRNKTVAVVGGGDVALEDALYLANVCEKVYLIHRRDEARGARYCGSGSSMRQISNSYHTPKYERSVVRTWLTIS